MPVYGRFEQQWNSPVPVWFLGVSISIVEGIKTVITDNCRQGRLALSDQPIHPRWHRALLLLPEKRKKRVCWRVLRPLLVLVCLFFVCFWCNLHGYHVKYVDVPVERIVSDVACWITSRKLKKNRFCPEPKHERFSLIPIHGNSAKMLFLLSSVKLKLVKWIVSTEATVLAWRPLWEWETARRGRVSRADFSVT